MGQLNISASTSFASDTVSIQETGILFTLASAFPHTLSLDITLNHWPATDCITFSQTSIRLSYSIEKKKKIQCMVIIVDNLTQNPGFESQIRAPCSPKLWHAQHAPEPASRKSPTCGATAASAFARMAPNASSSSGWGHTSHEWAGN